MEREVETEKCVSGANSRVVRIVDGGVAAVYV
jgi:hypothetical protein